MKLKIEAARLKHATGWLKGIGSDYIQVANRAGLIKALAAVFAHGEVTLGNAAVEDDFSVYLEVAALQRFTGKMQSDVVTLDVGDKVVLTDGKTRATFAQPSAARNCLDITPKGVKRIKLAPMDAGLLYRYTAPDGKLSFARVTGTRAFAHDRIAAVSVPAEGAGFLSRRVLSWGGSDTAQFYHNAEGSFIREPETNSILYEAHGSDLATWPDQIPAAFTRMENFSDVFTCNAAELRHALQQYGKLDVDQAIRIEGIDNEATVTIHGTKTVIEDRLTTEADGAFCATVATATLVPFLSHAPSERVRFRYNEESPYLVLLDGSEARLLTPRGA